MDEKVGVDYREASLHDVNMTFQKACNIFSLNRPASTIRANAAARTAERLSSRSFGETGQRGYVAWVDSHFQRSRDWLTIATFFENQQYEKNSDSVRTSMYVTSIKIQEIRGIVDKRKQCKRRKR